MLYIITRFVSGFGNSLLSLAILGLCAWPVPVYAAEPDAEQLSDVYSRFAAIEEGLANLDRLEARLAREHTDPLARARWLDNDPAAIIADVTDSISYLPYAGSLRAADGTLASRSGNAVDQAVLLATMLNRAGLEARIVRGEIDAVDASELLGSTAQPAPGQPAFSEEDMAALREEMSADIPDFGETVGASSPEELNGKLLETLDAQQDALMEALGNAAPPENADLPEWMITAAQDYWWVQYRDEPAGAWSDTHPAFPDGDAPSSLEGISDSFYSALPRDAVQSITLRLEMEIQEGDGDAKTLDLVELENVPGSDLARKPVTISLLPDTLIANPQADITTAMQEANFMMAGLNGQSTHDPFTLSGIVLPPEALGAQSYGMAGLFSTVSDKGERAISALAGDENKDVFAIRTIRLVVTSHAPDMPDRRDTRILYDAVEPDGTVLRRESGDIAAELTGTYLIGARTGRVTDTGLAEDMLSLAEGYALLIEYDVFRDMVRPDRLPPVSEVMADLDTTMPLTWLAYEETRLPRPDELGVLRNSLARLGLKTRTIGMEEPPVLMPARPLVRMIGVEGMVRGTEEAGAPRYGLRRVIDLVSSPVVAVSPGSATIHPRTSLRAGLWMSRLEGDITPEDAGTETYNTATVLDHARRQGIPLLTLSPSQAETREDDNKVSPAFATLETLDLPRESRMAIKRDLEAGFAVLVPESLPEDVPHAAWWRVHPESGETLAMIETGRGAELAEYLEVISLGINVASVIMFAEGAEDCMSDDFNKEGGSLACCLAAGSFTFGSIGAGGVNAITPKHPAVLFAIVALQINFLVMEDIVGSSLAEKC